MASDMRLNDKPIAKDGAYIYAEAADGSQVKISKADLATVVAGLLPYNSRMGSYSGDVNLLHQSAGTGLSCWTVTVAATNSPFEDVGGLILNISRYNIANNLSVAIQIACGATNAYSNKIVCRTIHYDKSYGVEVVGDWKEITLK